MKINLSYHWLWLRNNFTLYHYVLNFIYKTKSFCSMRPWPHMLSGTKQPTWFSETWKFCSNKFFANRLKNTLLNPFWSLLSFVLYFLGKIMWSYFFSHFIKIFLDAFIICFEQMVNLYICVVARVSSLIYILSWYMKISSYFTIIKISIFSSYL